MQKRHDNMYFWKSFGASEIKTPKGYQYKTGGKRRDDLHSDF